MKKRGFTLIELLAVIVIVAVIALISVSIVFDSINYFKERMYSINENNILSAAENYAIRNTDLLPEAINASITVDLNDLVAQRFIKPVIDPKSQTSCTGTVKITKKATLEYSVCLKCGENYSSLSCPVVDPVEKNYTIYEEPTMTKDIYATLDTSVIIGTAIGSNKDNSYFTVIGYPGGYDQSGLLTFDISTIDMTKVQKIELYAYYYNSDVSDRQQTHPVRRMISPWTESTNLVNTMMSDTYTSVMTSVNPAGYGYGWRKADITDMITYWKANPTLNYGVVIDNNRGAANAGGIWSNMLYYSLEADGEYRPCLKVTYLTEQVNKYIKIPVSYDTSAKIGTTISPKENDTSLIVLGYNVAGYDESAILTFNLPISVKYTYPKSQLYAYYYFGDVPDRQQTHPVRRMISSWTGSSTLVNTMMSSGYRSVMTSVNPAGYGYGWRMANTSDVTTYWELNPTQNYGLAIDNNRGATVAGGIWNSMSYYSKEAANGNEPYLKVYIAEK